MTTKCRSSCGGRTNEGRSKHPLPPRQQALVGRARALGITDIDCVPYATRHSLATRIIEATGDLNQAKKWLGHSTITLTADTYGHVNTKYLPAARTRSRSVELHLEEARITRDSVIPESDKSATATTKKVN